ncbi:hypothetical protein [Pseudoflavitalea rhizosphaerae]|uniref:hypothetical protein n=1 Tax=Pseudoflavitalea rhizosphaerae TaxID=1884793 RepID=UPI000F8DB175|nr:hypothetical protein [Pseudoflavitalea rhizosphaerae]
MFRILLFFFFIFTVHFSNAQQISVAELRKFMDYDHFRIDTTLKKRGYLLMQKDIDSTSSLYQYSHIDHREEDKDGRPTVIRSVQYMDVNTEKYSSRLFTYRTYDKEEYKDISSYLLSHNFRCTEKYKFQGAENLIYNSGGQTIRIKIFTTPMGDGRKFTAYEVELGK